MHLLVCAWRTQPHSAHFNNLEDFNGLSLNEKTFKYEIYERSNEAYDWLQHGRHMSNMCCMSKVQLFHMSCIPVHRLEI